MILVDTMDVSPDVLNYHSLKTFSSEESDSRDWFQSLRLELIRMREATVSDSAFVSEAGFQVEADRSQLIFRFFGIGDPTVVGDITLQEVGGLIVGTVVFPDACPGHLRGNASEYLHRVNGDFYRAFLKMDFDTGRIGLVCAHCDAGLDHDGGYYLQQLAELLCLYEVLAPNLTDVIRKGRDAASAAARNAKSLRKAAMSFSNRDLS